MATQKHTTHAHAAQYVVNSRHIHQHSFNTGTCHTVHITSQQMQRSTLLPHRNASHIQQTEIVTQCTSPHSNYNAAHIHPATLAPQHTFTTQQRQHRTHSRTSGVDVAYTALPRGRRRRACHCCRARRLGWVAASPHIPVPLLRGRDPLHHVARGVLIPGTALMCATNGTLVVARVGTDTSTGTGTTDGSRYPAVVCKATANERAGVAAGGTDRRGDVRPTHTPPPEA